MPYQYYNVNPNGYHVPDCVIRAIKTALGLSYYQVMELLHMNGDYFQCDDLNVQCYEKLLDYDFNLPHFQGCGASAEEIATYYCDDIVILRMEGHLSTSVFGIILDIWDCRDVEVTDYWLVPNNQN